MTTETMTASSQSDKFLSHLQTIVYHVPFRLRHLIKGDIAALQSMAKVPHTDLCVDRRKLRWKLRGTATEGPLKLKTSSKKKPRRLKQYQFEWRDGDRGQCTIQEAARLTKLSLNALRVRLSKGHGRAVFEFSSHNGPRWLTITAS